MNCLFLRRGYFSLETEIAVELKTNGNALYCYMTLNGTKIVNKGSYTAQTGDEIIFGIYGSTSVAGWVKIDGETVLTVSDRTHQEYSWTIPRGTNAASISMSYIASASRGYGHITVTTS